MVAKIAEKNCGSAKSTVVSAAELADKQVYRSWEGVLDGFVQPMSISERSSLMVKLLSTCPSASKLEIQQNSSVPEALFSRALARRRVCQIECHHRCS